METLFVALGALVVGFALAYVALKTGFDAELRERLRENKDQVAKETLRRSSATVKGQMGERFAPFVPGFGYEPADARFLGSPIDYVVFDGLADGQVRAVVFVEVKTGSVPLSPFQRQVQEAIKDGRVDWRVVQLPE